MDNRVDRLKNLRSLIERRRQGLISLDHYSPENDRQFDDVIRTDPRNHRELIRHFSTAMEVSDPLGGTMVDPLYYTSSWNVGKALRKQEPRIPVASIAFWVQGQGYPKDDRVSELEYPKLWRSHLSSLEELLNIMGEGTGEVPLSLIAFEFGFEAFVHFFNESSDATIWDCSIGGWMLKRRMINHVAKDYDGWEEEDICGTAIHRPSESYHEFFGHEDPIVQWISEFTEIYMALLDGDCGVCPNATRELLYLIFRGQDIRHESSHGVMNLEDCISLMFDLFLSRDYLVRSEKEEYGLARPRLDVGDLEQYVADIASDLLSAYVLWFPEDQVVMDLIGYISAQVRDRYIDPSPVFDSALDRSDPIELCLLDDWSISSLTRALMTRYGLKSKHPAYRRILDDDSKFYD